MKGLKAFNLMRPLKIHCDTWHFAHTGWVQMQFTECPAKPTSHGIAHTRIPSVRGL